MCESAFGGGHLWDLCSVELLGDFWFFLVVALVLGLVVRRCVGSLGVTDVCAGCLFLRGWWEIWELFPFRFLMVNLMYRSFFFQQKSSSLPYGKSRRYEYGGLARGRAAVVEHSRSGLRSRPKDGCGPPIGCKRDAELPGSQ